MQNVLHFSTADNEGGSARSAYRIHRGLKNLGWNSHMLVGKKVTADSDIDLVSGGKLGRFRDLLTDRISRGLGYQYFYVPSSKRILRHPWVLNTKIIQLFNTHGGYFSLKILPELCRRAKVVWRLSDMWPMVPHAAYTYGCECYRKGPDSCICALNSYPQISRNTKHLLWEFKKTIYENCSLNIVAPSSWIEKCAKESLLLSRFPVMRIPNGIDTNLFSPRDKKVSRAKLGIPETAKVMLFTAHGLDRNPRKGSDILLEILQRVGKKSNAFLVLAGKGGESFESNVPFPVHRFGYIADPSMMAAIYSAADISLVPSMAENLPNNLLEGMACGLPTVAFDTGGISDAVIHMETGYLAKSGDTSDFAFGIEKLLDDPVMRSRFAESGRKLIDREFNQILEVQRFAKLYENLIKSS